MWTLWKIILKSMSEMETNKMYYLRLKLGSSITTDCGFQGFFLLLFLYGNFYF